MVKGEANPILIWRLEDMIRGVLKVTCKLSQYGGKKFRNLAHFSIVWGIL